MSSWITGLADKAENILNKIDKNAATALQIPTDDQGTSTSYGLKQEHPLNIMKKSLSGSTQSLKATFSPARKAPNGSSASSVSESSSIAATSSSDTVRHQAQTSSPSLSKEDRSDALSTSINEEQMTLNASMRNTTNLDAHELAAFKIALSEVTSERDELRFRLSELNNDVENIALRQRGEKLEILVQRFAEERDKALQDLNEAERGNLAYVHSISELESNIAKLQQEYMSTAQRLQMQIKETDQQRKELQNYRTKAQHALQTKDALIAKLNTNKDSITVSSEREIDVHLLQIEFDAVKQELQQSMEEQQKLRLQLDDYQGIERQNADELSIVRVQKENLNKELRIAREQSFTLESEMRIRNQELSALQQQLSNHKAESATRLQEKQRQIEELRRAQLYGKNLDGHDSKEEYEKRLKALTQSLFERQGALESITAERNALRLQFEKAQQQIQEISTSDLESQRRPTRNSLLSNSTDDAKAQFPLLMHPNPFDNRVARRVKRAYSTLDSMGIRLGAFLRRYPLMRIGVLVYVALLHIWVMFVLLSTTPNN